MPCTVVSRIVSHGLIELTDGIEVNNAFLRNLGAATYIPDVEELKFESDDTPSTFWITHPTNRFEGNVAGGAADSGFWFEIEKRGPHAYLYPDLEPRHEPLISFRDNVAHSNREDGIRTYPRAGYRPLDGMAHFTDLKLYRNDHTGL